MVTLEQQVPGTYTANYRGKAYVFRDKAQVDVPDDLAVELLEELVPVFGKNRDQVKEIDRFREVKPPKAPKAPKADDPPPAAK